MAVRSEESQRRALASPSRVRLEEADRRTRALHPGRAATPASTRDRTLAASARSSGAVREPRHARHWQSYSAPGDLGTRASRVGVYRARGRFSGERPYLTGATINEASAIKIETDVPTLLTTRTRGSSPKLEVSSGCRRGESLRISSEALSASQSAARRQPRACACATPLAACQTDRVELTVGGWVWANQFRPWVDRRSVCLVTSPMLASVEVDAG